MSQVTFAFVSIELDDRLLIIVHVDNWAVTTWDEDSRVPIQSLRDILVFSWIFNLVFHLQVHLTDLVFIVHSHGKCPLLERRGSAILRGDIDLEANLVKMVHRSECLSGVMARLQESTIRAGQEELWCILCGRPAIGKHMSHPPCPHARLNLAPSGA